MTHAEWVACTDPSLWNSADARYRQSAEAAIHTAARRLDGGDQGASG